MTIAIDGTGGYVSNGSASSVNLTLSTSGAGIVVLAVVANAAPTGATSAHLTFTPILSFADTAGVSNYIYYYYAVSSGALSSESITVNLSSSTFVTVIGQGISGTATSSVLDADSPVTVINTANQMAVTLSTATANTIILMTAVASAAQFTVQSGFTQLQNSSGFNSTQYKIVSTTQSSLSIGTTNFFATMAALAIVQASGVAPVLGYPYSKLILLKMEDQ